jgi:hypothetical protein
MKHRLTRVLSLALAATGGACHEGRDDVSETAMVSSGYALAIAPALNFSGSNDLDPVRVADILASELGAVQGLTILPVSRTVAVLAREGKFQIESPAHALRVAQQLGCDAICVPGVTDYNPYTPIVVGLALQLYMLPKLEPPQSGKPMPQPTEAQIIEALTPQAQIQAVYNGAHSDLAKRIKKYADSRDADKSPLGWRRYMVSQELFLRYCCWDSGRRLIEQQAMRSAVTSFDGVR